MTSHSTVLERRRQVLLARVSLQRFALRGDIGVLRASARPPGWHGPVAVAALGVLAVRFWTALARR